MSLGANVLAKGLVARVLAALNPDSANNDVALRQWSYGELVTQPMIRKNHALADEGSYWTLNSGQTGITPPLGTAFSATAPAFLIYNADQRKLALDYLNIANIVAVTATTGTAGSPCPLALVIDNGNRYSSGGTALTLQNVNQANQSPTPNVSAYYGAITATAASGAAKTPVGYRVFRPEAATAAMTVVGDDFYLNFGGVENVMAQSLTIANASLITTPLPPIILGFNQSLLVYMWWPNFTPAGGASGMVPEAGFWMR